MVTKGRKTGGRQPISPAGPAVQIGARLSRELAADLMKVAEAMGRHYADIVRDGIAREVARLKRGLEKRGGI